MAFDSSIGLGVVVGATVGSTFGGAFATVDERLKRTRQHLGQLRPTARVIGAVAQYTRELDELRRKQVTAAGVGQDLGAEIRAVEGRLRSATDAARSHGVEIGDAVAQHRRLAEEVRRTEGRLERFERRAARQAERQRLLVAGAQVYGAVRAAWSPISSAIEHESVMANVRKVVDFDGPAQFAAMSRAVLDLSARLPVATSGLGEIIAEAGQAGIARGELLRFAEDAANMGIAFDLPAAGGRTRGPVRRPGATLRRRRAAAVRPPRQDEGEPRHARHPRHRPRADRGRVHPRPGRRHHRRGAPGHRRRRRDAGDEGGRRRAEGGRRRPRRRDEGGRRRPRAHGEGGPPRRGLRPRTPARQVDRLAVHEPTHQEQIRRERRRRRAERNRRLLDGDEVAGGDEAAKDSTANLYGHATRRRERRQLLARAAGAQIDQSDRSVHVTITGPIHTESPEQLIDELAERIREAQAEQAADSMRSDIIDPPPEPEYP